MKSANFLFINLSIWFSSWGFWFREIRLLMDYVWLEWDLAENCLEFSDYFEGCFDKRTFDFDIERFFSVDWSAILEASFDIDFLFFVGLFKLSTDSFLVLNSDILLEELFFIIFLD